MKNLKTIHLVHCLRVAIRHACLAQVVLGCSSLPAQGDEQQAIARGTMQLTIQPPRDYPPPAGQAFCLISSVTRNTSNGPSTTQTFSVAIGGETTFAIEAAPAGDVTVEATLFDAAPISATACAGKKIFKGSASAFLAPNGTADVFVLLAAISGAVNVKVGYEDLRAHTPAWESLGMGPLRGGMRAGYDEGTDRLILFGGADDSGDLNTTVVIERASGIGGAPTVIPLNTTGDAPLAWGLGATVYDGIHNRLIVHGGCAGHCSAQAGTWVLSNANGLGGDSQWSRLLPDSPVARAEFSGAYDSAHQRLIVFGGDTGFSGSARNDVWVMAEEPGTGAALWTELNPQGARPLPRANSSVVYDAASNRLIVFGGEDGIRIPPNSNVTYNDVWVLTNANGLDGSPTWIQLSPTGSAPSHGNAVAKSVFDPTTDRLVVFGGQNHGELSGDHLGAHPCEWPRWCAPVAASSSDIRAESRWEKRPCCCLLRRRRSYDHRRRLQSDHRISFGSVEPARHARRELAWQISACVSDSGMSRAERARTRPSRRSPATGGPSRAVTRQPILGASSLKLD